MKIINNNKIGIKDNAVKFNTYKNSEIDIAPNSMKIVAHPFNKIDMFSKNLFKVFQWMIVGFLFLISNTGNATQAFLIGEANPVKCVVYEYILEAEPSALVVNFNVTGGAVLHSYPFELGGELGKRFRIDVVFYEDGQQTIEARHKLSNILLDDYNVTVSGGFALTVYNVTGGSCNGQSFPIGLDDSNWGVAYQLIKDNVYVGNPINGNGNAIDFGEQPIGTYEVDAIREGGCVRRMEGVKEITQGNLSEEIFNMTGGGVFCEGGVAVGIDGSEEGVMYQFKRNGLNFGSPIEGTGAAFNFTQNNVNVVPEGTYTAEANVLGCISPMAGTAIVNNFGVKTFYSVSGDELYCAGEETISISLSASESDANYFLKRNGNLVPGSTKEGTNGSINWQVPAVAGIYQVWAYEDGDDGYCWAPMEDELTVTLSNPPNVNAGPNITAFITNQVMLTGESPQGGAWSGTGVNGNTFTYNISGDYPVTYNYTNNEGCSAEDTRIITLLPRPVISYVGLSALTTCGQVTISVPDEFATYQWYNNLQIIIGQTTNSLVVNEPGSYHVKLTTQNGYEIHTEPQVIEWSFEISNMNYVETSTPTIGVTNKIDLSLDPSLAQKEIQYFDGFGRLIQSIIPNASPEGYNIITPFAYNDYGRQTKTYLPYVEDCSGLYKSDAFVAQEQFYQTAENIASDSRPFSETIFEPSPLNRAAKQYGPGEAWYNANDANQDKPISYAYAINIAEEVQLWEIGEKDGAPWPILEMVNQHYDPHTLHKNVTIDEEDQRVITFTNKQGQTVLKRVQAVETPDLSEYKLADWADTHYVYDDFGNLRFVLPPEAVTDLPTSLSSELIFQYSYDYRQRMVEKQVPGAGKMYMVYDNRDRLVLTQDANQRAKTPKEWIFTKYDALNRPIFTGIHTYDAASQAAMQTVVNDFYKNQNELTMYESTNSAIVHGYTNNSYPQVANEADYLSVTYYDNYTIPNSWAADYAYDNTQLPDCKQANNGATYCFADYTPLTKIKGQVTGSKVKNLDDGTWLKNVIYYDKKYRAIQSIGENHKGGVDKVSNLYDFVGQVLETKLAHGVSYEIEWQDVVGVSIEGNTITKTAEFGWGNAGAFSVNTLEQGQDGWVSMTALEVNKNRFLGLSETNANAHYNAIDYAIYLNQQQTGYAVYENGAKVSSWYALKTGQNFKIERIGATIYYKEGGQVFHESAIPSNTDLFIDIALNTEGATIHNVKASFKSNSQTGPNLIMRNYDYDHAGRLMTVHHKLNQEEEVLLIENEYNELGELIDKKLHSEDGGSTYEQSVDYQYNIRGWLTHINDDELSDGESDYFGMELAYHSAPQGHAQYNGNIGSVTWKNATDNDSHQYDYGYDPMNRILEADYSGSNAFDVSGLSYDLNGNIQTLNRNNKDGSVMDALSYTYQGNQLKDVEDDGDAQAGFKESGYDYIYDANGNWIGNPEIGDVLSNGDFEQGNSNWQIIKDDDNVISFIDGKLTAGASPTMRRIRQTNVLQVGKTYMISVDFEQTGATYVQVRSGFGDERNMYEPGTVEFTAQKTWFEVAMAPNSSFEIEEVFVRENGGISIAYNHLNLPKQVAKGDGQYIKYIYDAAGTKLAQEVYDASNELQKRTDYIGEFIYEQEGTNPSELAIIQHEEGRIVPNGESPTYQYHLKDHLGNTRLSFTTRPNTIDFTLNYESDENNADDETLFENIGNITDADIHDHTDNGNTYTKSQQLTGANGSIIGSVLTIPVGKDDQITAEVYAKYLAATQTSNPVASIGAAVIGAITGNTGAGNYEGAIGSSFGNSGSMVTNVFNDQVSDSEPMAFINLMFLPDEVGASIANDHFAFSQISNASSNAHAIIELAEAYTAPANGYVVVYLSNESSYLTEVYFDDLQVTVNESKVIQTADYYPFGLAFNNGYKRSTSKENKFLYNGKELQEETGWYDYGARMYMPDIGRWGVVDNMADDVMQIDKSPYQYAWNNPVNLTDPDGNCPWCIGAIIGAAVEIGTQVAVNAATGKDLTDIDWADVAVSTAVGAATAGIGTLANLGKASVKVAKVAKAVVKTTGEVVQAGADVKVENGKVNTQTVLNGKKDVTDATVDFVAGKATGAASGKVSKAAGNMLNSTANKTLKQANKTISRTATGSSNNVAAKGLKAATESTIKGNQGVVDKVVSEGAKIGTSGVKKDIQETVNKIEDKL